MTEDDLDDFVQAVRRVFFALRGLSNEMLADLGCSVAERGILNDLVERGPQPVPVLAEARAVSRQAMQKAVDALAARGLVSAEPNPRHQRSPLLTVTPAGRKLLGDVRARERRLFASLEMPVSDEAVRRATRTLKELGDFFSEPELARAARPRRRAAKGHGP